MQINAINLAKPSFSSRTSSASEISQKYHDDIDSINSTLESIDNLAHTCSKRRPIDHKIKDDSVDEFEKMVKDGQKQEKAKTTPKKNALEIGASIAGAALVSFVTGKGIALTAGKFFPNIADSICKKTSTMNGSLTEKANQIIQGEKTPNLVKGALSRTQQAGSAVYKAISKSGKQAETMANAVGLATTAVATPYFLSADNNEDGEKDFKQKGISMFESATSVLETVYKIIA